ncbi:fibrinogen-like protein 1 [Branchiostoma floridae]|uniref:Fibrinogen-like protein 1 n=1 Tax=Branchiostoma floridae TaxID=7739 RepID=A0A9J7LSD1_BRAFL|nr:fibrinogen-like protein 1 [Branchiostoma floridae]
MEQLRTSLSAIGTRLDSIRAKDCGKIYRISKGSMDSGIYTIYPRASGGGNNSAPLRVFCRVEAGRAWTVIQRRQDGSVDFYNRTWEDYSRGFGNLTGEFWLGNDNIHLLTSQGRYKLDVDLRRFANCFRKKCHPAAEFYMQYDIFLVENAQAMYKLHLGNYTGTKGQNWWRGQNTAIFRNKPCSEGSHSRSCYLFKMGGFWVHRCDTLNPNGYYYHNVTDCPKKSQWKPPGIFTFRYIEMRISKTE